MAVTNELTIQQREVIFEDMAEVTRAAAKEGADKMQAGFQVALLIQYDLGVIVNRVYEAENLNETQKKDEIKKLSAYWNQPNLGPTTLYDLRNVSTAFDRGFIKEQVEERMSNGNFLTWSHFKELQKIGNEKRQLSVLKKIRQHSWSSNELALELQGKKESEVKRTGGRKPTLPKTPNAMLQKLFTSIQSTDNYFTAVSEPLEGIFLDMPPHDVDAQFIENIENTLERLESTGQHLKDTERKLKKVRTRALNVLKASTEEEGAEEETVALAAKKSADTDKPPAEVGRRVKKNVVAEKKVTSAESSKVTSSKPKEVRVPKKTKRGAPRRSNNLG